MDESGLTALGLLGGDFEVKEFGVAENRIQYQSGEVKLRTYYLWNERH